MSYCCGVLDPLRNWNGKASFPATYKFMGKLAGWGCGKRSLGQLEGLRRGVGSKFCEKDGVHERHPNFQ
jgi:hypothetical protein